jgi:hypothetical protein
MAHVQVEYLVSAVLALEVQSQLFALQHSMFIRGLILMPLIPLHQQLEMFGQSNMILTVEYIMLMEDQRSVFNPIIESAPNHLAS